MIFIYQIKDTFLQRKDTNCIIIISNSISGLIKTYYTIHDFYTSLYIVVAHIYSLRVECVIIDHVDFWGFLILHHARLFSWSYQMQGIKDRSFRNWTSDGTPF